ncbi:MAG TPA: hypothetical protein VK028_03045 [Micromonosporaceae bacterium]|nr:hypothetical protein [Micromonosporaceae bacterium]
MRDEGDEPAAELREARAAFRRRDWRRAWEGYSSVATTDPGALTTDDLSNSADAAWWLGLPDESMKLGESAYRRFLTEERPHAAAHAALGVATSLLLRGEYAAGSGWLSRAARLLADVPECADQGYLRYLMEVEGELDGPDLDGVVAAARDIQLLGRRFEDPTLVAIGILGEGRALIRLGQVDAGMAALDEAMVAVLADDIAPEWAGNIYCHLIAACHELADLRRAQEWLAITERWLHTMPVAAVFTGICRVHRSQFLAVKGEWERAEAEARRVLSDVGHIHLASVAEAHYTLGEIFRKRGDLAAAGAAYRVAHESGLDPQPGQALLLLAMGKVDAALASIRTALTAQAHNPLARARLCAAQVEIAAAAGDLAAAAEACTELEQTAAEFNSTGL